ncbi:DUF3800 domain-containing protein [Methylovulum psychrotolerans]|uniref:DUF3800 domain-containing protein n=1 Tax=Methylovulum psychrotolerans TaxID=1704499 RepID=A0A2S5CQM0_9GAMM|nr:DUF3800 domain-containing protein [Methylovulum psychrotolerans]POZ53047.1 hypothetical protein AADEFJLK_00056 [Methylovulum psychrotolerans]
MMEILPILGKYKVFCDESCHFEYDNADVMVLGAIACPEESVEGIVRKIKSLRYQYNYKAELKWPKLHGKQLDFYKALIDLFLEADVLRFKAIVADKKSLAFGQFNKSSYEDFYCTMFYYAVRDFLRQEGHYKLYFGYSDRQSRDRVNKLLAVLPHPSDGEINAYIIRSHESQLMQLCALLVGALSYRNRLDIAHESQVKNELLSYLELKLRDSLAGGTPLEGQKWAVFRFPSEGAVC